MVRKLLKTRVAPFLDQLRSEGRLQLLRELMPIDHAVTALIEKVQQHVDFLTRKPKVQGAESVLELKVRDNTPIDPDPINYGRSLPSESKLLNTSWRLTLLD
jgi:hypothetical protein